MTETTNRYIVQGFASDSLSAEARDALPATYRDGLKSLGLEGIVNSSIDGFSANGTDDLAPFQSAQEITGWYEQALLGTKKAMVSAKLGEMGSYSRQQDPLNHLWLYKTLAMNLNRGLSSALINYLARESLVTMVGEKQP